jgi:hypothetical protein
MLAVLLSSHRKLMGLVHETTIRCKWSDRPLQTFVETLWKMYCAGRLGTSEFLDNAKILLMSLRKQVQFIFEEPSPSLLMHGRFLAKGFYVMWFPNTGTVIASMILQSCTRHM